MISDVKKKALVTGWQYPANQDACINQIIFDFKRLLPNANVAAWVKEHPVPPHWVNWADWGEKPEWVLEPSYEPWIYTVTAVIESPSRIANLENARTTELQRAWDVLEQHVALVRDYTYRKSDAEVEAMRREFEKIEQEGPPMQGEIADGAG